MSLDPRLNPETAVIPEEYISILESSKRADFSRLHVMCPLYESGSI